MTDTVKTVDQELAELMRELSGNPATRETTLRAIKKLRPETVIPELDNRDAVDTVRQEMQAQFDQLRQDTNNSQLQAALAAKRASVQAKHGLTDDELVQAETLFKEGKISDYDTAADYLSMQKRLAIPTPARRHRAKPFEGIDFEKFQADPEGAALEQMYKDLDDITSGRVQIQ